MGNVSFPSPWVADSSRPGNAAGPLIILSHSMLFHYSINNMPQKLNSCLYQFTCGKIGFLVKNEPHKSCSPGARPLVFQLIKHSKVVGATTRTESTGAGQCLAQLCGEVTSELSRSSWRGLAKPWLIRCVTLPPVGEAQAGAICHSLQIVWANYSHCNVRHECLFHHRLLTLHTIKIFNFC